MSSLKWEEIRVSKMVSESISIAEVLRKLDLSVTGGNYNTFYKKVSEWNLDTSHFRQVGKARPRKTLEEICTKNSKYPTSKLKKRLYSEGILKPMCISCGLSEFWNGSDLVLQLDHVNGISSDHRISNLRILCPNCHSQTSTWAGRNQKPAEIIKCGSCKSEISGNGDSNLCKSCIAFKSRETKIDWPSCEDLIQMIKDTNYSAVGRKLGVSDNAVRKRLRNHYDGDLP